MEIFYLILTGFLAKDSLNHFVLGITSVRYNELLSPGLIMLFICWNVCIRKSTMWYLNSLQLTSSNMRWTLDECCTSGKNNCIVVTFWRQERCSTFWTRQILDPGLIYSEDWTDVFLETLWVLYSGYRMDAKSLEGD